MSFLDQFEITLQRSLREIEQNLRGIQDIIQNQDIVLKTSKKQYRKKKDSPEENIREVYDIPTVIKKPKKRKKKKNKMVFSRYVIDTSSSSEDNI